MRADSVVKYVLSTDIRARSDDKHLMIEVWRRYGLELTPVQREKLRGAPSAETITRLRRRLQEDGQYTADDRIRRGRQLKSMIMQQTSPKLTPESMAETLEQVKLV